MGKQAAKHLVRLQRVRALVGTAITVAGFVVLGIHMLLAHH